MESAYQKSDNLETILQEAFLHHFLYCCALSFIVLKTWGLIRVIQYPAERVAEMKTLFSFRYCKVV